MKQCNDMHKNLDDGGEGGNKGDIWRMKEKENKFGAWDEGDLRAKVLYSRDHGEIS